MDPIEPPAIEPAADETQDQPVVETDETVAEAAEAEAKPTETPTPGTPDKALQKLQQESAAQQRLLEAINDKLQAGQTLTPKEQRKIDAIRDKAEFDLIDDGAKLRDVMVEQDGDVQSLKTTVARLQAQVEQESARRGWFEAQAKYPKVERPTLEGIWQKAIDGATKLIGDDDPAKVLKLANRDFDNWAKAANEAAAKKTGASAIAPKPVRHLPTTPPPAEAAIVRSTADAEYERAAEALGEQLLKTK